MKTPSDLSTSMIRAACVFSFALLVAMLGACGSTPPASNIEQQPDPPIPNSQPSKPFNLEFNSDPLPMVAGEPAVLVLTIKDQNGKVVGDLPLVDGHDLQVFIVSADLTSFYRKYPNRRPDGSYELIFDFPNGGAYDLFVMFTPVDSPQVIEKVDLNIEGIEKAPQPLVADRHPVKTVGGLRVSMSLPGEMRAGKEVELVFSASDAATGQPPADLEQYLGETAHFEIVSQDLGEFVHTLSRSKEVAPTGDVSIQTTFHKPGLYKIWSEFQRAGKVITIPFVLRVEPSRDDLDIPSDVVIPPDAQWIAVSKDGFKPEQIYAQKDRVLKLAFYRVDDETCADEVVFKQQGITKKLPLKEVVIVEIKPTNDKPITFACGMDMFSGKILVE